MILGNIIAGALAIVWDIEQAFVSVNITSAGINRTAGTCSVGTANATLTNCGITLSDQIVNLVTSGVQVLNHVVAALNLSTVAGR